MNFARVNHRKTQKEKDANDLEYYKSLLDSVNGFSDSVFTFDDKSDRKSQMQINYDLYNNKIDVAEFNYVCKPFGESDLGELPANLTNRDIISGKIKAVESMEILEPFDYSVIAVNEEATTRKEGEQFGRLKEFVVETIMMPIRLEAEKSMQAILKNKKELSPEETQQLQQNMEMEIKAKTPDEVYKYMQREHQDPAEILAVHLLNYLKFKEGYKRKMNQGWKHALITAHEIFYVNHDADLQPSLQVVNPLRVIYDTSSEAEFIEDRDWFAVEYRLSTTEVIKLFGNDLTEKEIDTLYEETTDFSFGEAYETAPSQYHKVLHSVWVSLRKIGFLTYIDKDNNMQETIVPEDYKLMKNDIDLSWEWIPEVHEGYKINSDMYKRCGPVVGQIVDIDNLYKHKLPYCGVIYDNLNSEPVSIVDRMKHYQFYYNIIMYRIEMLMASDKGKILLMNIKALPQSANIDMKKFLYYMEALKIAWVDPSEEGARGDGGVANLGKEIDMSLISDIQKYMMLAEYIEKRCGDTVGITKQIEGQIPNQEAVSNAKMNFQQASSILQTYFDLHSTVKRNVLALLLEKTKALFSLKPHQKKLQYILDDMTLAMFEVDFELLDSSTYGIFVTNSIAGKIAKETVQQLAHAALQNDKANLATISKIMRKESIQEAEELLEKSEREAQENLERLEKMRADAMEKDRLGKQSFEREMAAFNRETLVMIEKMKADKEIRKQLIMSQGFKEDADMDKDNTLDILELAKEGLEADIKIRNQRIKEEQFEHDKEMDREQLAIAKKKASQNVNRN